MAWREVKRWCDKYIQEQETRGFKCLFHLAERAVTEQCWTKPNSKCKVGTCCKQRKGLNSGTNYQWKCWFLCPWCLHVKHRCLCGSQTNCSWVQFGLNFSTFWNKLFPDVKRVSGHELKVSSASIYMAVSKRTTLRNYYIRNFNIIYYINYSGAD